MAIKASTEIPVGEATLEYVPPIDAPFEGAMWDDERDWPGVRATITLPTVGNGGDSLRRDLRDEEVHVFGQSLNAWWGANTGVRARSLTFRAPTLEASEALAEEALAAAAATLATVVQSRAARLARRASTIACAHARHGRVTP